jgi:hypothetical protein
MKMTNTGPSLGVSCTYSQSQCSCFSKCLLGVYGRIGHQCQAFSRVVIDDGQDAEAATDPRIKTVDDAVVRYFRSMFQVSVGAGTLALGLAHRSILRLLSGDCCLLVVFP